MLLATLIAGLILIVVGFLRLGTYIKFIPFPVTVGFTAGIGVIIFASQIKDLLGLTLDGPEPGDLLEKIPALAGALGTVNVAAVAVALASIGIIVGLRRVRPSWHPLFYKDNTRMLFGDAKKMIDAVLTALK
jgi:SulP family sulfate permease